MPFLVFFTHVFSCLLSWCLVTWLFFTFPHVFLLFFPMFFSFSCVSCMQSHTTWVNNATRLLMHYLWSNAISLFCVLKKSFFQIVTFVFHSFVLFHVLLCSLTNIVATRLLYCVDRKKWKVFLILEISKQLIMLFLLFLY